MNKFITETEVTVEKIAGIEENLFEILKENAKVISHYNKQKPKRIKSAKIYRIFMTVLLVFMALVLILYLIPSDNLCSQIDYLFAFGYFLFILFMLIFVFKEEWITRPIFNFFNKKLSRLHTNTTFKSVKTEFLPFRAVYEWTDNSVNYKRRIGESEKEIWQRENKAEIYDLHNNFVILYDGYYYPSIFIFVEDSQHSLVESHLKNEFGLKSLNEVKKN